MAGFGVFLAEIMGLAVGGITVGTEIKRTKPQNWQVLRKGPTESLGERCSA